jgi:tellurite resistance protein TehA-like permease
MRLLHVLAQLVDGSQVEIPQVSADNADIISVTNVVFAIAGAVALLIITIAGTQYVLSMGDPQKTAKAKNTILYAVVGLVIVIASFGIAAFIGRSI